MNWVRILRDICAKPQVHWSAYQIYCRYHEPKMAQLGPDPDCKHCNGTGMMYVRLDEHDVDRDVCYCAMSEVELV